MRRHWVDDLNSWEEFSYLRLKGVPMKRSKEGGAIDMDRAKLEKIIARGIVQSAVPLCGKELRLLRSATELSMHRFGLPLGVTGTAIYHWEQAPKRRLSPMVAVAVRLMVAELLGVALEEPYSRLLGVEKAGPVEVAVTNKRRSKRYRTKKILRPSYRGDREVKVRVPVEGS